MKISIMGYSGAGKSTLGRYLGEHFGLPVLHLDTVQFLPGWEVRPLEEKQAIVTDFLDWNPDGWVVDGNYSKLEWERRLDEADEIVLLLFDRLTCLSRVIRRYRTYRNSTRPDMAEGCSEKLDADFVKWILWKGRTRTVRQRFRFIRKHYPEKVTVLRHQRALDAYQNSLDQNEMNS